MKYTEEDKKDLNSSLDWIRQNALDLQAVINGDSSLDQEEGSIEARLAGEILRDAESLKKSIDKILGRSESGRVSGVIG